MNHASELTLHMLLSKLGDGSAKVSEDTIEQIVSDVREALFK